MFDGGKKERFALGLREVEKRVEGIAGRSRGERLDGFSSSSQHHTSSQRTDCMLESAPPRRLG